MCGALGGSPPSLEGHTTITNQQLSFIALSSQSLSQGLVSPSCGSSHTVTMGETNTQLPQGVTSQSSANFVFLN